MGQQKNTNLPAVPIPNIFQLVVAGKYLSVKRFWEFIKTSPAYRLTKDIRLLFDNLDENGEMHIVMQVEETPCYPSSWHKEVSKVHIHDQAGNNILFTLLDVQMVEVSKGIIYIRGKNFDIFADPSQVSKVERLTIEEEDTRWK